MAGEGAWLQGVRGTSLRCDWLVFVFPVQAGAGVGGEADSNRAPLLLLFQGVRRPEPLKIKGE